MTWGATASASPAGPSLADIMSEQLVESYSPSNPEPAQVAAKQEPSTPEADGMTQEERDLALALKLSLSELQIGEPDAKEPTPAVVDAASDLALAKQLQDDEQAAFDQFRANSLRHYNGKVKLKPRFDPNAGQRRPDAPKQRFGADDAEALAAEVASIEQALTEQAPRSPPQPPWPRRNKALKGQGGDEEIITKHDAEISGRKNWERLSEDIRVGKTGTAKGVKLTNKVYNSLKQDIKRQKNVTKGLSATVERDTIQTYAKGLDQKTRLILHKLVNLGLLNEVHGAVRTGKEAIVYHATGYFAQGAETEDGETDERADTPSLEMEGAVMAENEESQAAPPQVVLAEHREFAVKVFKTTLNEFKNRLDYVKGDHRFADIASLSHQNPRKVVALWAEKEMRNLSRAWRVGIPCPYPIRLSSNVLVMEFVGKDGWAAPQLKECELSPKRAEKAYVQLVLIMQALIEKCGMIHCDLSEYNVLYMAGRCVVIDFGQALLTYHQNAAKFLLNDCSNVSRFFRNRGVQQVLEPQALADLLWDSVERVNPSDEAAAALVPQVHKPQAFFPSPSKDAASTSDDGLEWVNNGFLDKFMAARGR